MLSNTMNLLCVGAVVVTGVSILVNIVSMSTYYWFETEEIDGLSESYGLWKFCTHCTDDAPFGCFSICVDLNLSQLPDWYKGTQAAAVLAFITNLAAVAVVALFAFMSTMQQNALKMVSIGLLGMTVIWNMVAIVVFEVKVHGPKVYTSWSWGLQILAVILEFISIFLLALAKRYNTPGMPM